MQGENRDRVEKEAGQKVRQTDRWVVEEDRMEPPTSQPRRIKPFRLSVCWGWIWQTHVITKWEKAEKPKAKGDVTTFQFTLTVRRKSYLNFFQYICSISEWSVHAGIVHLFGFWTCWIKTIVNAFFYNSNGVLYFFAF